MVFGILELEYVDFKAARKNVIGKNLKSRNRLCIYLAL